MAKRKQVAQRINYKRTAQTLNEELLKARAENDQLKLDVEGLRIRLSQLVTENAKVNVRLDLALRQVREKEHEYEARKREDRALLMRARDLLIHEKVSAQFDGRALPTGRDPYARPNGWRVNGIGELIDAIDQNSR